MLKKKTKGQCFIDFQTFDFQTFDFQTFDF